MKRGQREHKGSFRGCPKIRVFSSEHGGGFRGYPLSLKLPSLNANLYWYILRNLCSLFFSLLSTPHYETPSIVSCSRRIV